VRVSTASGEYVSTLRSMMCACGLVKSASSSNCAVISWQMAPPAPAGTVSSTAHVHLSVQQEFDCLEQTVLTFSDRPVEVCRIPNPTKAMDTMCNICKGARAKNCAGR
jgi:hypothetical protein